ncbi:MAG: NADH-quinone oxidoreductase subunit N [Deltaproteobacteria bacterium]|nr:NADH-quinone oxidoreductase subunit N [Deltaproteobacteria bacterium]
MSADLARILPEVVLTLGIVAVLMVDLLWKSAASRRGALAASALAATVGALVALVARSGDAGTAFSGMLALDGFATFFRAFVLVVAVYGVWLGATSDEIPESRLGEFLLLLLCLTLGLAFLASARNLLMIYLAIELVSIPSYILAGFRRGDRRSSEAALKYVIYGAGASGLMLYGFSLIYGLTGSLDLAAIGGILPVSSTEFGTSLTVAAAAILSLAGFGYKVAAVPFHMWCPDVYEGAPTPFVAFLSVGPKAAGLAALIRFLTVAFPTPEIFGLAARHFPWALVIGVLAIATMTLGNVVAIAQDNVKRLLAYSSIAHAGYLLMGVAVASPESIRAVMMYLGVYLAMNLGAFGAVLAVRHVTGYETIGAYKGLGARSPLLAVLLAIFLFSLTGVPPFGGFIGKFYLFASVLHAGTPFFYALAIVGVLNTAVSLYAYARVLKAMYFESLPGVEPPRPLTFAHGAMLVSLAIPTLVLGIWWSSLIEAIKRSSAIIP